MRVHFYTGGDDGEYQYNGAPIDFATQFAKLGFPATIRHVAHLHEVEFLSCRLVSTSTGWNFVPMVGKTIAKLGYSVRAQTPHIAKRIARGAAMSVYSSSSGCPPLRAYLDAVLRVTSDCDPITPRDEPWRMNQQATGDPTPETWSQLGDIYGWSQPLQFALENALATVDSAGSIIDSPALQLLCDRDTGRLEHIQWRPAESDPSSMWVRDLTCDGVEPNPGPPKKMKKKVEVVVVKKTPVRKVRKKKTVTVIGGIKGHGGYGADIGSKIGGWVGDKAASFLQSITGFGDYTVRSNSITNSGGSPPQFGIGNCCTIRHREFVANVASVGAAFNITPYPINPKSPFFPWLSEIALSFEQYKIKGMVVEFKTTSATAVSSTNTALGSVILATQYNVLAPPFTTQQQMEAYQFCTSCVPSQTMIHPIECDPNQNSMSELYVDSSLGDPRLEYLGTTYLATVGQQAASVIGELWVTYEIDLIRPKLFSGAPSLGLSALWRAQWTGSFPPLSAVAADFFSSFRTPSITTGFGVAEFPAVGTDFPMTFPTANMSIQVPGWVSGTYVFEFDVLPQASSFRPWSNTGGGALTIVSGAATIAASIIPTSNVLATPLAINSGGSGSGSIGVTWAVNFKGTNPGVPVVFQIATGWNTSGDSNPVNTVQLLATACSIPTS
jgi:hypothetical protein